MERRGRTQEEWSGVERSKTYCSQPSDQRRGHVRQPCGYSLDLVCNDWVVALRMYLRETFGTRDSFLLLFVGFRRS